MTGVAKCVDCIPGQYQNEVGKHNCTECVEGKYRGPKGTADKCLSCDLGKNSVTGSATCTVCIPGKAGTPCTDCLEGKYRGPEDTADECLACRIGQYSTTASSVCSGCDLGKFGATAGTCDDCPVGKYNDLRGSKKCSQCPVGKTPNQKRTACEKPAWKVPADCEPRVQYLNDQSTNKTKWTCVPCQPADGIDCSQPSSFSTLSMQATGFWNASWGNYPSFHKCPRPENCQATNDTSTQPCLFNSDGPLCAVCLPNHFVDADICKSCEAAAAQQQSQLAAFIAIFGCFLVIFHVIKKHAKRLYKKFGRDILRILTINLGFAQINSTIYSVINIQWPTSYIQYVKSWNFVNFDFTSLLNLSCAGDDWDYRSTVAIASAAPLIAVVVFAVMHVVQRWKAVARLKKLSKTDQTVIAGNIFDYMDKDGTDIVDEEEFAGVMRLITVDTAINNTTIMRDLGATSVDASMELTKNALVKAFTEHDFGSRIIGKRMLKWAELQRVRSSTSAGLLLVLFFLHAPVSQRIFHYFVCHDIAGRAFLRVDYSLSCTEDKYMSFRILPFLMLILFTAGIPVVISVLLCVNRKRLHTPSIRAQLGFLYASFRPNAGEYWEVHELLRKLMLMGALVLIESTKVRMIVALLVCVVSVMSLNYFQPHKNGVVLLVAQSSFLLTTFKYILAIVLDDVTDSERETLGSVLIFLDVCFVLGSVGSLFAVIYLLHSRATKEIAEEEGSVVVVQSPSEFSPSTVVPAAAVLKMQSQVRSSILKRIASANANSRKRGTSRLKRGDTAAVVNRVVQNASEQVQLKIKQLEGRKRSSMSRLKNRLEKRKSKASTTLQVSITAVNSDSTSDTCKVKCQDTQRVLLHKLESKEKLHTFMDRVDKKHTGTIQRKHVEFLIANIRKRFHSEIAFDDDVWKSMKENSKLVNNPNAIEHDVLEEWVFLSDIATKVVEPAAVATVEKQVTTTKSAAVPVPKAGTEASVVVVTSVVPAPESAPEVKCKTTKAILLEHLESKETLQTFVKQADKRHPGIIRKKNVKKMMASINKTFHLVDLVTFDEDVWQSMKKNSRLVNNANAIEHEVLEKWVFGE